MNTQAPSNTNHASSTAIAVIATNLDGVITVFNQGAERMLGYRHEEVVGKQTPMIFFANDSLPDITKPYDFSWITQVAKNCGSQAQHWIFCHKNGHHVPINVNLSLIHNDEQNATGVLMMATNERELHMTPLKALPNRNEWLQRVNIEIERARRNQTSISVLILDADQFQSYQAYYGLEQANQCLCDIANLLRARIRRAGDFLAYYGDDQFAVCLPDTTSPGAVKLAEILRLIIATREIPHLAIQRELQLFTVSVGIMSALASNAGGAEHLLKQAIQAVQTAKQAGGNCSRLHDDAEVA